MWTCLERHHLNPKVLRSVCIVAVLTSEAAGGSCLFDLMKISSLLLLPVAPAFETCWFRGSLLPPSIIAIDRCPGRTSIVLKKKEWLLYLFCTAVFLLTLWINKKDTYCCATLQGQFPLFHCTPHWCGTLVAHWFKGRLNRENSNKYQRSRTLAERNGGREERECSICLHPSISSGDTTPPCPPIMTNSNGFYFQLSAAF